MVFISYRNVLLGAPTHIWGGVRGICSTMTAVEVEPLLSDDADSDDEVGDASGTETVVRQPFPTVPLNFAAENEINVCYVKVPYSYMMLW